MIKASSNESLISTTKHRGPMRVPSDKEGGGEALPMHRLETFNQEVARQHVTWKGRLIFAALVITVVRSTRSKAFRDSLKAGIVKL